MRKICSNCGSEVKWVGCTPYGESYICKGRCLGRVTFSVLEADSPGESVTRGTGKCVVCGAPIEGNAHKKTCSSRCRVRLHRENKAKEITINEMPL